MTVEGVIKPTAVRDSLPKEASITTLKRSWLAAISVQSRKIASKMATKPFMATATIDELITGTISRPAIEVSNQGTSVVGGIAITA